jgi:Glycosyltransferases, probably involved in cell wall biogenesis
MHSIEEYLPKVSLIISFYNKIDILKLVLAGLEKQSFKEFEVIIADDGSKAEVVNEIKQIIANSKLNIIHIWHEDLGWRKNIALNNAIIKSKADYLVFIDGDCILHKHFIKEHYLARQQNVMLAGRRVYLSERVSQILKPAYVKHGFLENLFVPLMIIDRLLGKGSYIEYALYIRSKWLRKKINNKDRGILGSNFSIHKQDILAINGFDERYASPYLGEDTDLEYRLRLNGIKVKTLKFLAIQYHFYHERLVNTKQNESIFEDTLKNKYVYTPYGIKKQ